MTSTLYVELGQENLGIIYANPENHRKGLGGIIADFTIVDAPNDLKSEIGCFSTLPLSQMVVIKKLSQETRDKILKRCKISIFLGDASVGHEYLKLDDESLLNSYGWLLENWDESLDLIPCH